MCSYFAAKSNFNLTVRVLLSFHRRFLVEYMKKIARNSPFGENRAVILCFVWFCVLHKALIEDEVGEIGLKEIGGMSRTVAYNSVKREDAQLCRRGLAIGGVVNREGGGRIKAEIRQLHASVIETQIHGFAVPICADGEDVNAIGGMYTHNLTLGIEVYRADEVGRGGHGDLGINGVLRD